MLWSLYELKLIKIAEYYKYKLLYYTEVVANGGIVALE